MLTKERLDQLFALRAAAKAEERQVDDEFRKLWGYDCFDREASEIAGRHLTIDRWSALRDCKPGIIAYEEADRTLSAEERSELAVMADCEDFDAPRLDLLMDCLEARQRHRTH